MPASRGGVLVLVARLRMRANEVGKRLSANEATTSDLYSIDLACVQQLVAGLLGSGPTFVRVRGPACWAGGHHDEAEATHAGADRP